MTAFVDRVAVRAADLRPARAVLSAAATPFYLLGLLLGVLWVVVAWMWAAVVVGVGDARRLRGGPEG